MTTASARFVLLRCLILAGSLGAAAPPAFGQGSVAAPGSPGCTDAFRASALVPGATVTIPGTKVSVRMPRGWTGRLGQGSNGMPLYFVTAPPAGAAGQVALGMSVMTPAEQGQTLSQLLMGVANAFAGGEEAVSAQSQAFTHGGGCGGRMIVTLPSAELYVTLIRRDNWIYLVYARYPQASGAAMRAGLDTLVQTSTLAPGPASAPAGQEASAGAVDRRFVGCWNRTSSSFSRDLNLRADGTYRDTSMAMGLPFPTEPTVESGRYQIVGGELVTHSGGQSHTRSIQLSSNDSLLIGGTRYFRCN